MTGAYSHEINKKNFSNNIIVPVKANYKQKYYVHIENVQPGKNGVAWLLLFFETEYTYALTNGEVKTILYKSH